MELWKEIEGFEGNYLVSNKGRIFRRARTYINPQGVNCEVEAKELTPTKNGRGYLHVKIRYNGKRHTLLVHRLVASAFVPNPEDKPQVNHLDGDKTNNTVNNLIWVTARENIIHAWETGLRPHNYSKG